MINLGFACICQSIKTGSFKTTTVTSASKLSEQDRFNKLQQLTRQNFSNLYDIMKFNVENNIHLYRVSSDMCPLNTHEICNYDFTQDPTVIMLANKIKQMAVDNGIRLSIHISQFAVINTDKESVFQNTVTDLEYHYKLMQMLGIEIFCIHVGGKTGGIELARQRFIDNFDRLPQHLQSIIHLENCDKSWNVQDTLSICEELNIPMIVDLHHDRCLPSENNINCYIDRIKATWKTRKPKCHISSGRSKADDKAHNDYITVEDYDMVRFADSNGFDIMLEAKCKDKALFEVRNNLK